MKPLPWSHSSLNDFVNCPRSYHRKRIVKDVKEEESEAIIWGNRVHKAFENRIKDGTPLPQGMEPYESYLASLEAAPGEKITERKIALSRAMNPCQFFGKDVWFRGVIDLSILEGDYALLVDYKTGKPKNNFDQLKLFAIYTFLERPEVESIDVRYYWTQTFSSTQERYTRDQIGDMWKTFIPNLKQYAEAFATDTWQPRPSGLCGWCPVKDCEFWRPRRR
jgi:hypothetical protein